MFDCSKIIKSVFIDSVFMNPKEYLEKSGDNIYVIKNVDRKNMITCLSYLGWNYTKPNSVALGFFIYERTIYAGVYYPDINALENVMPIISSDRYAKYIFNHEQVDNFKENLPT